MDYNSNEEKPLAKKCCYYYNGAATTHVISRCYDHDADDLPCPYTVSAGGYIYFNIAKCDSTCAECEIHAKNLENSLLRDKNVKNDSHSS